MARLISLVEDESPLLREVMAGLAPYTGNAQIVGITGLARGRQVDLDQRAGRRRCGRPASGSACSRSTRPRRSPAGRCSATGCGCRTTRSTAAVYIRSMASRGHLGGLAWSTPQALRVLDAAGCDVVLIETVGVGQSEVEIAGLADTTLVLLAPGMGDGIQAAKAGILEIGDVYVVNKADRDGADQVRRDLRNMLALADRTDDVLEAADRADRRRRPARASTRSSRRSTSTAPGWSPRASSRAAGYDGRATRSRRSR